MKSFIVRLISAAIALVVISILYHFLKSDGLRLLTFMCVVLGTAELIKILFKPEDSFRIKGLFYVLMVFIFIMTVKSLAYSSLAFAASAIVFFSSSLVLGKKFDDLNSLSVFQAKSILGFLYLGLLPGFACKLLDLPNGESWFVTLLATVFAGDSFAYIFGVLWGERKIMPDISPKKTYVGSMGGLLGSILISLAAGYLMSKPWNSMLIMGIVVGVVAQFGDLFESLLKRVADIKDSGNIMPGHGGVLDRIDGVLFASPFVYLIAFNLESF